MRTPRIVRILSSICSIGIGGLGFFGIGDTDYSETLRVTSLREIELRGEEAMKAIGRPGQSGNCTLCG
jgi:hypothetical protein